jgi:hypothetical protein
MAFLVETTPIGLIRGAPAPRRGTRARAAASERGADQTKEPHGQFTVDAPNKWLTLVSNLGVAAGFVLLATQIKQSADEIRLQQLSGRFDGTRTAAVAMFGETAHSALATALLRPSELNADQITQLWALLEMYVIDADEMFTRIEPGTRRSATGRSRVAARWSTSTTRSAVSSGVTSKTHTAPTSSRRSTLRSHERRTSTGPEPTGVWSKT